MKSVESLGFKTLLLTAEGDCDYSLAIAKKDRETNKKKCSKVALFLIRFFFWAEFVCFNAQVLGYRR